MQKAQLFQRRVRAIWSIQGSTRIIERVHAISEHVYEDADAPLNMEKLGVEVISAQARFVDRNIAFLVRFAPSLQPFSTREATEGFTVDLYTKPRGFRQEPFSAVEAYSGEKHFGAKRVFRLVAFDHFVFGRQAARMPRPATHRSVAPPLGRLPNPRRAA